MDEKKDTKKQESYSWLCAFLCLLILFPLFPLLVLVIVAFQYFSTKLAKEKGISVCLRMGHTRLNWMNLFVSLIRFVECAYHVLKSYTAFKFYCFEMHFWLKEFACLEKNTQLNKTMKMAAAAVTTMMWIKYRKKKCLLELIAYLIVVRDTYDKTKFISRGVKNNTPKICPEKFLLSF